jgi:indole-3-glycerol phosphate synthase
VDLAVAYQQGGAAALSVVTEPEFFWGDLQWLTDIRKATSLPLLRKDFVFCDYQLWQSRAAGADAVLLILAMLSDQVASELLNHATDIGLQCLVEIHDSDEARRAANLGVDLVGVNNRDLKTFEVSLETAIELAPLLPATALRVAESGISDVQDCQRLQAVGYQAFLIGEALVTADFPAHKIHALRQGAHAD